ncbi:MAG: hypothetical protein ACREV1_08610 [Gammaproteobacteria bacterium]
MDPTILAAVIGAIATVVAVVIGWFLQRPMTPPTDQSPTRIDAKGAADEAPRAFARRYLEYPSHYRFIKSLPKLRAAVLENAQEGWDTGVTADMREASYDVIDFLEYAWLRLAQFYPEKHWDKKGAEVYIREYIQSRFSFHWAKHEPDGPGTGGTIVGVLTGGDVMADLEGLIADTVSALFKYSDDFNFQEWKIAWEGKTADAQTIGSS